MSPVTTPRGLRPWWHGRQGLDRGNLWHGWNQRYGLTWGKRGDGWHRWNRGDGRFHDASAWPAPHLIGAAYSHRDDEKWHEPEHDDHQHGSASHRVCPPGRNEAGVCTFTSVEYTDETGARQHHRCSRPEIPTSRPRLRDEPGLHENVLAGADPGSTSLG